jgi:hypothetical protein
MNNNNSVPTRTHRSNALNNINFNKNTKLNLYVTNNIKENQVIAEEKANERINKLLNYLSLRVKPQNVYQSMSQNRSQNRNGTNFEENNIKNNSTFLIDNISLVERHFNTFRLSNIRIQEFLIKKKWSLYQDFHLLLCRFSFYPKDNKIIFFDLFTKIKELIITEKKNFCDVAECGSFINEYFINNTIFTDNDSIKKDKKFIDLRLMAYLYFYKYELLENRVVNNELFTNNYFKINTPEAGIAGASSARLWNTNITLKTSISHINEEINIWKSIENKNIIIIFRGSYINEKKSKIRNIKSDLSIVRGSYSNIHKLDLGNRLQYSIELYIYISKLYNNYSISLGGFSLGGTTVYYINKYIGLKNLELINENKNNLIIKKPYIIYSFNPGRSFVLYNNFDYIKYNQKKVDKGELYNNMIIILSKGFDIISFLNRRDSVRVKKIYIDNKLSKVKKDSAMMHSIKYLDDKRFSILNLKIEDFILTHPKINSLQQKNTIKQSNWNKIKRFAFPKKFFNFKSSNKYKLLQTNLTNNITRTLHSNNQLNTNSKLSMSTKRNNLI